MGIMDTLKKYQTPILYIGIVLVAVAVVVKYYGDKISGWVSSLKGAY
jgi:hypothetical protein